MAKHKLRNSHDPALSHKGVGAPSSPKLSTGTKRILPSQVEMVDIVQITKTRMTLAPSMTVLPQGAHPG